VLQAGFDDIAGADDGACLVRRPTTAHGRADMKDRGRTLDGAIDCLWITKFPEDNLNLRMVGNFGWRQTSHEQADVLVFVDEAFHERAAQQAVRARDNDRRTIARLVLIIEFSFGVVGFACDLLRPAHHFPGLFEACGHHIIVSE